MSGHIVRRVNRYRVTDPDGIDLRVGDDGQSLQAVELVDISTAGCCFSAERSFERNTPLQLSFQVDDFEHSTAVRTRWATPSAKSGWLIGVEFEVPATEANLDNLASKGVIDRRQDPRRVVQLPVEVRTELESGFITAELVDYSGGGFRVDTDSSFIAVGARLMMKVPVEQGSRAVYGKVAWTKEVDEPKRFLIGCEFVSQKDHATLARALNPEGGQPWSHEIQQSSSRKWVLIAAVLLLFLSWQAITAYRNDPELFQNLGQFLNVSFETVLRQVRDQLTFLG